MKLLLILVTITLCGCSTPNTTKPPVDVFMRQTDSDGYIFQLWERPDGTRYIKNPANQKIMEMP